MNKSKISKSLVSLKGEIDKARTSAISLEEQERHIKESVVNLSSQMKKIESNAQQQDSIIRMLETQLKDAISSLEAFEIEVEQAENAAFKLNPVQIKAYESLKLEAGKKTGPLRLELDAANRTVLSKESICNELKIRVSAVKEQIASQNEPMLKLAARKDELERQIHELNEKKTLYSSELESSRNTRVQSSQKKKELIQKLEHISQELLNLRADRHESEKDIRINDCLSHLKRIYPGVKGRLSELCKPVQRKYNTAVAVGLGKNFDAVIVEDEATAMECIQYFKDQRAGVITLIPLQSIKCVPLKESLRRIPGSFKPLIDVIQYEDMYYNAIQYACGNTLICDSVEEARKLCYGNQTNSDEDSNAFKVVTLNGSIIHRNGNMTGGVSGVLEKSYRWDEQEFKRLKEQKSAIESGLQIIESEALSQEEEQNLSYKLDETIERLKYYSKDVQATQSELQRWETNVKISKVITIF
jgi:structural maintenance of chromosome 1